jgi:type IV pilus assembly protein PilC
MDMSEGQGSLPALTQTLMNISTWLLGRKGLNAGMVILAPFAVIAILRFIRQFRLGRLILDTIKLKMPIIGQLSYKISVARWTRTLGTLISAGVPILEALNITRDTAGNEVYARALNKVHHAIRQGDTFANPLRQSKTVDSMVVNMIDVGEETGDMDKMLEKIANNYDEETDALVAGLMSLLEPVMVVTLGLIVGTIVIAMFLPMVRMITVMM